MGPTTRMPVLPGALGIDVEDEMECCRCGVRRRRWFLQIALLSMVLGVLVGPLVGSLCPQGAGGVRGGFLVILKLFLCDLAVLEVLLMVLWLVMVVLQLILVALRLVLTGPRLLEVAWGDPGGGLG